MDAFTSTPITITLQHCWEAILVLGPLGLLLIATLFTLTIGGRK